MADPILCIFALRRATCFCQVSLMWPVQAGRASKLLVCADLRQNQADQGGPWDAA